MDIKGFHLELTNICTLKCPRCSRTDFIEKFPNYWKNYSLNLNDLKSFIDIDINGLKFDLRGNYGDPIYHPNLIEFCQWIKENNGLISLHTNGSHKKPSWWEELASVLNEKDEIIFGIDGLPENFTNYRINADWNSIKNGIDIIADSKIKMTWKYIVFSYNENNIEQARALAETLKFNNFAVKLSDRWTDDSDKLKPTSLIRDRYTVKKQFIDGMRDIEIDPECINNKVEHFITADGHYSPCCYIADHRFYYKTFWGKQKDQFSIKNNTITKLLGLHEIDIFNQNLIKNDKKCYDVCRFNCSKITA
jgi:pyruvate-formate lyase-activating enzyme